MPNSERPSRKTADEASAGAKQLRIDPPHALGGSADGVDVVHADETQADVRGVRDTVAVAAGSAANAFHQAGVEEQLQLQAEQLGSRLKEEQQQLDRRESELHAQLADQENEAREMRLWLRERQREFELREAEMAAREQEISSREAALASADREQAEAHERAKADQRRQSEAFAARQRELDDRQRVLDRQDTEQAATAAALARLADELRLREERLGNREARFNERAKSASEMIGSFLRGDEFESLRAPVPADDPAAQAEEVVEPGAGRSVSSEGRAESDAEKLFGELVSGLKRLRSRQRNLEEAEALLDDGQAELDDARRRLDDERHAWQQRCERQKREIAATTAQAGDESQRKEHVLKSRTDQLQRRAAAVDQLRAEVLRAEREALEMRLATDEVWAQLMTVAPPAALSQSLAQTRAKLAEHYRLERSEIAGEKKDLEALLARIDDSRERTQRFREEVERWAAGRQADIEGQAARLAAREQELDRRQVELEKLQRELRFERSAYEAEIRRLLGKQRRDQVSSASLG